MDLTFFKVKFDVYPNSVNTFDSHACFLIQEENGDQLCITGCREDFPGRTYQQSGYEYTLCALDHKTAEFLRRQFPFCAPIPVLDRKTTFGVGDRLGLAGPGHLRVFKEYEALPVLAQQSIRELTLTHRTMYDAIDCATFAVFRDGYRCGFGVDGDHLKSIKEVQDAVDCGCTMITLDCSESIDNDAALSPDEELEEQCAVDEKLKTRYLGRLFDIGPGTALSYNLSTLRRVTAVYGKSIEFIDRVYQECLLPCGREINLELSLDETLTVTSPLAHYFVANELKIRGIRFDTIAPRFSGEFQKGIDYIGDPEALRNEVRVHNVIARYFGYKISFHSGSDKFTVFPILNEETQGRFHIKTSGTNWLEAARVIAKLEPALFREMYEIAAATFEENRRFYHVTPDLSTIPNVACMPDEDLPGLLNLAASRQVLHIGYGKILEHTELKSRMYQTLWKHRQDYSDALYDHIGRHARTLRIPHGHCAV